MEIDTNNLHHAYLLLGKRKEAEKFLESLFLNLNISPAGNPDIHLYEEDTFGIDEARSLKFKAASKSFGPKKIFIIHSTQITLEAQNAFLKVFEEPTADTHFIIINERNLLLPTLLSRVRVLKLNSSEDNNSVAKDFLASDITTRLAFVKNQLEIDSLDLPEFVDNLLKTMKEKKINYKDVSSVFGLSKFSTDPAANPRLILEHLALTLPVE